MQNPANFQKLKEQFKLKSRELDKLRQDRENSTKELSHLLARNQEEITSLKKIIKKNEEEIALQQSQILSARRNNVPRDTADYKEGHSSNPLEEPNDLSTKQSFLDPVLKNNIKALKDQIVDLKKQFDNEKENNKNFQKINADIQKELDRLQIETSNPGSLRKKIEWLESRLKEEKSANLNSNYAREKILKNNKLLIKKYESFLYGEATVDSKGIPPSVIIKDLKTDLEKRRNDNRQLTQKMDFLLEENKELESKIMFLEEQGVVEAAEYTPKTENRIAVTAEFSNGLENFLITYSDLITLVLVIFVLLYSVSKVDPEKFSEAFSSFQEREFRYDSNNAHLTVDEAKMLKRVRELVKDNVDPESLVRSDVRTILLRLKSSDLFLPGSAELIAGAEELIINSIAKEMQDGVKQIHVDGHTDDVPMKKNRKFPTNWELSSVRASHVARVIIDNFNFSPERIVVAGYGQYRPFKPNNSDLNRALNRRVEIKILKDLRVTEASPGIKPVNNQDETPRLGKNLSIPNSRSAKASPQKP